MNVVGVEIRAIFSITIGDWWWRRIRYWKIYHFNSPGYGKRNWKTTYNWLELRHSVHFWSIKPLVRFHFSTIFSALQLRDPVLWIAMSFCPDSFSVFLQRKLISFDLVELHSNVSIKIGKPRQVYDVVDHSKCNDSKLLFWSSEIIALLCHIPLSSSLRLTQFFEFLWRVL